MKLIYLYHSDTAQAVAVAAVSAGTGAIPILGVGAVVDFVLISGTIAVYYTQFGLNNTTAEELKLLGKKYMEIIARYQFSSATEFASTFATKSIGAVFAVEQVSAFIPIIGIALAGSISFAFTLRYLFLSINELEEAAMAVWDNAAKRASTDRTNDN